MRVFEGIEAQSDLSRNGTLRESRFLHIATHGVKVLAPPGCRGCRGGGSRALAVERSSRCSVVDFNPGTGVSADGGEALIGCHVLNRMLEFGRPASVAITA